MAHNTDQIVRGGLIIKILLKRFITPTVGSWIMARKFVAPSDCRKFLKDFLLLQHGMGNPSLSIMVHEILKLLQYARAKKPITMIRIGTCGGIGIEPGTTIISENVFNGLFQSHLEQYVLGRPVRHPAILDRQLREDLIYHASKPEMNIPVVSGNTLCSNDFYEEQGRLDGAFCDFTHEDQMEYLGRCANVYGIRNFEMESLAFAAMTHRAGVRGKASPFIHLIRGESRVTEKRMALISAPI